MLLVSAFATHLLKWVNVFIYLLFGKNFYGNCMSKSEYLTYLFIPYSYFHLILLNCKCG